MTTAIQTVDPLQRAYALLVDALRAPRKKVALEHAVDRAARAVRAAIAATGADPDAAYVQRAPLGLPLPEMLHVTVEQDTDDSQFLIAHEDGILRLDNGQRVGTYRLESTGIVQVTVKLMEEAS